MIALWFRWLYGARFKEKNIAVTRKAAAVENYGSREQEIHDRNYKLFSLLALSDIRCVKGRNSTLSSDSISGDIECEFV